METDSDSVLIKGKPLKILNFLKKYEHKPAEQPKFGADRNSQPGTMKRVLENGAEADDGEPSEKKDKSEEGLTEENADEGSTEEADASEKSAKDYTMDLNLLFLQSTNPLLDKMEIQDVLLRCDMNASKAGRVLKLMSEERREKQKAEKATENGSEAASVTPMKTPPASSSSESGVKSKADYKKNEQMFARMCRDFPLRDRMFIQQSLVQAKWDEFAARNLIRTGPKLVRLVELTEDQKKTVKRQQQVEADAKKAEASVVIVKKPPSPKKPPAPVKMKPLTEAEINKAINASFKNIVTGDDVEEEEEDEDMGDFGGDVKIRTLALVNTAPVEELALLPGLSKRKAEFVVKARPYNMWSEIKGKLERPVALSVIDAAAEMFRVRDDVTELMQRCTKLSKQMAGKVRQIVSSNASDLAQQPKSLGGADLKLAPYQLVGLNWLTLLHKHEINGILADEMGLGKTIQVIAFLAYLKEQNLLNGASAIVVPASTFENWSNELQRWCPDLQVVNYSGSQEERKDFRLWWKNDKQRDEVEKINIILTTYNQIGSTKFDRAFFRTIELQYIIYDEAHMLKNMTTQRYSSLMQIQANRRILLTGTPLQNNLIELMSLLIFVMPHMLGEMQAELTMLFKMANRPDRNNEFETRKIEQARKIMEPFVLRRLKKDVLKDLPSKTNHTINVELSSEQAEIYKELVADFFSKATQEETPPPSEAQSENGDEQEPGDPEPEPEDAAATTQGGAGLSGSMTVMMMMRRAANHPTLIRRYYTDRKIRAMAKKLLKDKTYKEDREESIRLDLMEMSDHQIHQLCRNHPCIEDQALPNELLLNSGKFHELDRLLPKLQEDGHRVLMFSQFTQMMDIMEDYLSLKGYRYFRLDGQTPVAERQGMVDEFNSDETVFMFMLSTRAGGLGINLTAADTVIIHDIDLNPYNDKQAEDRCHRVGQTRPVTIYKMVAKNTIEDAMHMVAQNKLNLEQQISGGGSSGKQNEKKLYNLLKEALMTSTETS